MVRLRKPVSCGGNILLSFPRAAHAQFCATVPMRTNQASSLTKRNRRAINIAISNRQIYREETGWLGPMRPGAEQVTQNGQRAAKGQVLRPCSKVAGS